MIRPLTLLVVLCGFAAAALLFALGTGSVTLSWAQVWTAVWTPEPGLHHDIVLRLRWPRAGAALFTGAMLGVAGALMQALLRNPLADPYILGVSGGAAAGALLALLAGVAGAMLTASALAGALLSMLLVFGLAHGRGGWTPTRLLLTGVVVAAGWGAVISFLLAVSPEHNLRGMLFWLMGDLSDASWSVAAVWTLVLGLLGGMVLARALNLLGRGETQAAVLGVSVGPVRIAVYFLASLLTAVAVTIAGTVGFIGLVVPHLLRLLGARDYRVLLPASALLGGTLLVVADTLARSLLAPRQLPVGVLTAMIGVPVFLFLLQRAQLSHER